MAARIRIAFRIGLVVGMTLVLILSLAGVAAAADPGLTPEQESLARSIEGEVIAPCCWTQTVDLHESQAAEQVKMEIRLLIAQGNDKGGVLDALVLQYGEGILASPRARGFNWLAYLLPLIGAVAAGAALLVMIPRWRRAPEAVPVVDPHLVDGRRPDLRERLDRDLSHFD